VRALVTLIILALAWTSAGTAGAVTLPPANGAFDYQLGGAYPPPPGSRIVTRDRTESPAPGVYSICYVNALQTQAGELRWWRSHHRSLLLRRRGRELQDPGWPGEVLLDTSTRHRRARIARVIGGWIRGCARKGFKAVEPDNLDSWTRSRGRLTSADNFALARRLIAVAHRAGLAIAQKNAAENTRAGRRAGFDFAVAESCQVYDECNSYTDAYGAEVLEIEYADEGGQANFEAACRARGASISIDYRDRNLVTPDDAGYVDRAC
jgi:hypothetical protein